MAKVVTGKVRLSYVNVFVPKAPAEGAEPKYSVMLLIPKADRKTVAAIKDAIEEAKKEGAAKFGGKVPAMLKTPLRDGDAEYPDKPEYEGMYFMNANASLKNKPAVVDADRNDLLDQSELYSGCWGRASLSLYAYNVSGNRGIAAGLNALQKIEDGDYLGGKTRASDDFADDDYLN